MSTKPIDPYDLWGKPGRTRNLSPFNIKDRMTRLAEVTLDAFVPLQRVHRSFKSVKPTQS